MVIKTIQLSTVEAARWIAAATVISAFIWSVGGFIALALWNLYRDDIIKTAGVATTEDVQRVELRLAEAAESFAVLTRQIVVLSRPDQIVLYREPPRAVDGFCIAGDRCVLSVFGERSHRALECRIIGDHTELLILADDREYVAQPVLDRPVVNLGSRPRALEPKFVLPEGIPAGTATAIIRSHYEDCTWQNDGDPPVIQDSPVFNLEILAEGAQ